MTANVLSAGPVASIAEAVQRMRDLDVALPAADGLAQFNRMYLLVTETVAARADAAFFEDAAFMIQLDVTFANLYFSAVRASVGDPAQVPRAWAAMLERRADPRVTPLQFALAGMNAHINRDLPVAVVSTCRQLGTTPDAGSHRADYDRINPVLADVEREIRQSLESEPLEHIDAAAPSVGDVVVNWKLLEARAAAWTSAQTLWILDQFSEEGAADYLNALDGLVGFAGRGLLTPVVRGQLPATGPRPGGGVRLRGR